MDLTSYSPYASNNPSLVIPYEQTISNIEHNSTPKDELYDRVQKVSKVMADLKASLDYEKEMLYRAKMSTDAHQIIDYSYAPTFPPPPTPIYDVSNRYSMQYSRQDVYRPPLQQDNRYTTYKWQQNTNVNQYPSLTYSEPIQQNLYPNYLDPKVQQKYLTEPKYIEGDYNNPIEFEALLNMERDKLFNGLDVTNSQKCVLERERRFVLEKIQAYRDQLRDVERKCKLESMNIEKNKYRLAKVSEQFLKSERGDGEKYKDRKIKLSVHRYRR